jgi:hypothetical protein
LYKRKVVVDPKLFGSNKVVMKQHGIQGYKIKLTRLVVLKDGTHRKETNTDLYPSTTEIYEVPPSFDETLLPPLPERDGDSKEDADDGPSVPKAASTQEPAKPPEAGESPAISVACAGNCVAPSFDVVEGAGAHPPTLAQKNPPKTLVLMR